MLTKLYIKNFKCFLKAEMALSPLNLLVGANSSGKSSAIQALRLCLGNAGKTQGKETQMTIRDKKTGQFNELNSFLTNEKSFVIGIDTPEGGVKTSYTFGDDTRVSTLVAVESVPARLALSLAEKSVFYLPANRDSAKDAFPMNMEATSEIGDGGEYVIDYYAHHYGDKLDDALIVDGNLKTLEGQVNHWLRGKIQKCDGKGVAPLSCGNGCQLYRSPVDSEPFYAAGRVGHHRESGDTPASPCPGRGA